MIVISTSFVIIIIINIIIIVIIFIHRPTLGFMYYLMLRSTIITVNST